MDERVRAVLDSALALTEAQRAEVVLELLSSIAPERDELAEDEILAELDRRRDDSLRDPDATIPWSELKARR